MVDKYFEKLTGANSGIIEGEIVGASGTAGGEPKESATMTVGPAPGARQLVIPMAAYGIGEIVRHRFFPFRGVIFDVDPEFANSDEWWEAIPEQVRPAKNQPFYHLLAENDDTAYIAYVSQQNLVRDDSDMPIRHPAVAEMFDEYKDGRYTLRREHSH